MKYIQYAFALLLFAGLAFAIQPAEDWDVGAQGRYTQVGQASVITEGGNVTELNLSSNISTAKWAGYWGNVTGDIVLAPNNANMFYTWTWSATDGGEVCAVAAASGFDWSAVQAAVGSVVDTIWYFDTGDTDSGTNTIATAGDMEVAGTLVTGTDCTTTGTGGGDIFETCILADNAAPTLKDELAFCVNITGAGTLFNGQTGDYELLTATNETAGSTETHYFWMELN